MSRLEEQDKTIGDQADMIVKHCQAIRRIYFAAQHQPPDAKAIIFACEQAYPGGKDALCRDTYGGLD